MSYLVSSRPVIAKSIWSWQKTLEKASVGCILCSISQISQSLHFHVPFLRSSPHSLCSVRNNFTLLLCDLRNKNLALLRSPLGFSKVIEFFLHILNRICLMERERNVLKLDIKKKKKNNKTMLDISNL